MTEERVRELIREVLAEKNVDEPAKTSWPPKGLPVLVHFHKGWLEVFAESDGNGKFRASPNGYWDPVFDWRYIPVSWELAPKGAEQWVVTSAGEQMWMFESWEVGDEMEIGGCAVIHVENRPEKEA